MKNSLRSLLTKTGLLIILFFSCSVFAQATFNSTGTGNWNSASTWTMVSGSDADGIPDSNDTVVILSGGSTVTVNTGSQACASLNISSSANNNTATLRFNSGTTLTVGGTVSMGGTGNRLGAINMTNGGTLVCTDLDVNNSSSTFTSGAGMVILTANNTLPNTVFTTFNDLTISGGTTTTSRVLAINGDFSVASGAAFATGATNTWTLGVGATTSISGTLTLANTATKTFTGNVIVNSGGAWNETGASTVAFSGNLQNDGTFTANTGTHTFSGTGKTISGAVSIPSLTINGTTTNNGVLSIPTALAGSSTLTNSATGTLNCGGTVATTGFTLTATTAGNIVNYNGAGQSVKNTSYSNLALSGSGTKTFSANVTIAANFSISDTAKADFNNGSTTSTAATLTLGGYGQNAGTWGGTGSGATNVNTTYFDPSTNGRITVGSGSCTAGVWLGTTNTNWSTSSNWCGNVVPTASTDVVIPSGTANQPTIATSTTAVCRNIAINGGATLTLASSASALLNISGNFTNNGTLTAGAASIVSFVGSSAQVLGGTSTTAFSNLTINTTTSATTVTNSSKAFTASGNLTITQGDFVTEATDAGYTVSGNVSVASNGTWTHNVDWDTIGMQFNVGGNIAIDGAYGIGAANRAHVQMTGSGKTIHTGTSAMNILTLNTAGAITADGPLTVNNNFWAMIGIAGGSFSTNGNTVVANGAFLNSGGTVNINGGSLTVTGGINCGMNPGVAGNIVLSSGTLTTDALTIGASGAINGAFSQTGGTLNVNGNVTIVATTPTASTFTCTNSPAINVSGNWTNNGNYTKATETVTFSGTSVISGTGTHSFHNVTISGGLTAPAAMSVSGTWTNNGTFTNNSGTITLNGSSQQTITGTAATTFHNLAISNTAGAVLGANENVNNTLSLTGGNLNISNKVLTMGAAAPAITGTFSAARMIIADGGGEVRKSATSNGTAAYTFPIGDNTGTAEYTPVVISAVSGSGYSGAYIGASVADAKHPNNSSTTNFLTRYWNISQSGITGCTATVTGTYLNTASDVAGTLGSIRTAQLDGTFNQATNPWVKTGGNVLSAATLTYTGATLTSGQTSAFTGITSANPTVSITGGGVTVCQNATVSLTAVPVGDAAFTYAWSGSVTGSTTASTATPNTAAAGGPNAYTVTVKDGNGISSAASSASNITVAAIPAAGTLTPSPAAGSVCVGTSVSATATAGSGGTGTIADELEKSLSGGAFTAYTSGTPISTTGQTSVSIRTRRTATGSGCTTSGYNTVTWTMDPIAVAGSIGGAATVCAGTNSTVLTLSGNTGAIQWQSSSDNITFANISGQTASTYTAVNLAATTYYRAVMTSGVCASATASSVTMTVSPVSVAGSISGATTVCAAANSTLLTLNGNIGTIQWQSSTDNVTFTNISGQTASTYTVTNIAATKYYRAVVTSGVCSSATTASVTMTVNPASVAGSISGAATVCAGTNSTVLTLSGNTGAIQWQSSSDNITFANISGQTASTYTAVNLAATTYYRAVVASGVCASATTPSVTMTVSPVSVAGSISGATTVCSGTNSTVLTLSGNTGTIQWQNSTDNITFSNIVGATSSTYTATNLTATTYYRAVVTSGVCSSATTFASAAVTVNPVSVAGSIGGAATVCSGTNSTVLTLSGNTGTIQWQNSTDNITFSNIVGATSSTYTATNLTTTTYYRAVATSGVCASATTSSVAMTVNPVSVAGSVSADQAVVCSGTNSTVFTLSGNTGTIQWQSSSDDVTFTNISGATGQTYTATNLTATMYYRAVVTSGACSSATTSSLALLVNPASVAGSISGAGAVCPGSDVLLTLSGNTGTIQWQSSSDNITFTNISGATAATYNVTNVTGTVYYRAVATSGVCASATTASVAVSLGGSTTWDGTSWSNGAPTSITTAVIAGNYTSAANGGNINACTLTVNNNAVVVISSGNDVTLNGALVVSSGSFTLENGANLLQATDASNSGNIIVKRNSSALKRLDYTLWSSPVDGQDLKLFSPATNNDRFYTYNTATNLYNSITPAGTDFETGKGYLIRMPNNHPTFAWTWNGQFSGVPHNGPYTFTMADNGSGLRFNLVGNPYPSPINMTDFVAANSANITGAIYFWRKTNNTLSPSYCSWTAGTFTSDGEAQVFDPQDIIQTGQGFFVESSGNASTLLFDNSMRVSDHANQFFRSSNVSDKSRIWLNATSTTGAFSQMALVYVEGADSNGVDMFDGRYINDGDIALNSMINSVNYVIQGRAPFEASDVVGLSFKATTAGSYTIAIDHLDGLFAGSQDIYLKDNLTGAVHDLKSGGYTFASEAGNFTDRFEVIYQLPLGTHPSQFNENEVIIYKQDGSFVINSGSVTMDNVKVFDIRGRLLAELKGVNASQTTFNAGETDGVLIVRIVSDTNQLVTKKIVN